MNRDRVLAWSVLFAVPTLLFIDIFLGFHALFFRDVLHSHIPMKMLLRRMVFSGEFPYWNPMFGGGQPLAASPEHELFYPLTWLGFLPNFHFSFHLMAIVHVHVATFGMYALLRSMRCTRVAAVIGGLSFGIGGMMLSGLNLFPYLFAFAWMPLTALFTRRFLLDRSPRDFALAAIVLGMQILVGEPASVLQAGIILGCYALYRGIRNVPTIGALSIVALLVAAVQVLPAIDHTRESLRARGMTFHHLSQWSFPPQRIAEFVFPDLLGDPTRAFDRRYWGGALYPERTFPFFLSVYSGLAIAAACAGGFFARVRGRWLFLAIAATSLLLAFGSNTPLLRILYDSGLARSVRYFEKFLMMGIFAAVVFGAVTLDELLRGNERVRKAMLAFTVVIAAIAIGIAVFSWTDAYAARFRDFWRIQRGYLAMLPEMLDASRMQWLLAAGRALLLCGLLFAFRRSVPRAVLLGAFVLLDLIPVGLRVTPRIDASFYDPPPTLAQFSGDRDTYRIFHLAEWTRKREAAQRFYEPHPDSYWTIRNVLPPLTPITWDLRMALQGDFAKVGLAASDDLTEAAIALSNRNAPDWISTIATMANIKYVSVYRDPETAFAEAGGDRRKVVPVRFVQGTTPPRYYFSDQMISIRDRRDFIERLSAKRHSRRVAFVYGPAFAPANGIVRAVRETNNTATIDVEADGRAFLVMSVTPHKYWRITIDGEEVAPLVTNLGCQGVAVPPGRHRVAMRYRNPLIAAGAAITFATLLALFLAGRRRGPASTMRGL
ncbi:MAG: YfhO family protein [Thermoanaerobaculia bacterium]